MKAELVSIDEKMADVWDSLASFGASCFFGIFDGCVVGNLMAS